MAKNTLRKIETIYHEEDFLFVNLSDGSSKFVSLDMIELGYRRVDTAVACAIEQGRLIITLLDGRILSTPLEWYQALKQLAPDQLANFELFPTGPYWREIDFRITTLSMLIGRSS